ncbi:potassium channel family protein [Halorarius halobius]|uniref:potassium channel family protein n=1 Tax=Halorarius halobius TaxID=2962671 RepID=UPI0020CC25B0|nr:potassium channel family protein [Halorarius halobius]
MTGGGSDDAVTDGGIDGVREVLATGGAAPTGEATCAHTEEMDGFRWHCHREPSDGSDRCLFHRPVDETDDAAVTDVFLEEIRRPGLAAKQFVGATFGTLDIAYETLATPDNYPVVLRDVSVAGDLRCDHATVDAPVFAGGLTVAGDASFRQATFEDVTAVEGAQLRAVDAENCTFEGDVSFEGSELRSATFADCSFEGDATFDRVSVRESLDASDVTVADDLGFVGAAVTGDLDCAHARVAGSLRLRKTTVGGRLDAEAATVEGDLVAEDATLRDDVTLARATVDGVTNADEASVGGTLELREATAAGRVSLDDASLDGGLALSTGTFGRGLQARDATVGGDVDADSCRFRGALKLSDSHVAGDLDVGSTTATGAVFANRASLDGSVDLSHGEFESDLQFRETSVGGDLSGVSSRFDGPFTLADARIEGATTFDHARFAEGVTCSDAAFADASFGNCTFRGRTTFERSTFAGAFSAEAAAFDDLLDLTATAFEAGVSFDDADIADGRFDGPTVEDGGVVSLRNATLRSGAITLPSDVTVGYDCTGATLGDVQLGVAGRADLIGQTSHPLFDHFRFHDTTFDGFDFGQAKGALAAADWRLHDTADELDFGTEAAFERKLVGWLGTLSLERGGRNKLSMAYVLLVGRLKYGIPFGRQLDLLKQVNDDASGEVVDDPTSEWQSHGELENTYLKAKNGADQVGDRKSAAEFFIQEMAYRRRKNRDLALGVGASRSAGVRDRLTAAGQWVGNYLLHATCGYGERLWRVVYVSSLTVFLWTLLYTLFTEGTTASTSGLTTRGIGDLGVLATPEGLDVLSKNLYFSVVTFTTLGYGDIQPVGTTARFLAGLESFVGALLVALVVFVLGRRVAW